MNCCTRTETHLSLPKRLAVGAVWTVSAFFRALGWRGCRFYPSCSAYAAQAFGRHGFLKASRLALGRLLRCHPASRGGYDPLRGL